MAYTSGNLVLIGGGNGYNTYRYDTMDAHTDVDGNGYFNNSDDDLNLAVGDIIDVFVWGTAVRTGTISTYGRHVVNAVASGVVDCSNVTTGTVTDSD